MKIGRIIAFLVALCVLFSLYAVAQQKNRPGSSVLLVDDPFDGVTVTTFGGEATGVQLEGSLATARSVVIGNTSTCSGSVAWALSFDAATPCIFVDKDCNKALDGTDFCIGSTTGGGGASDFASLDLTAGVGGAHITGGRLTTGGTTLAPGFEADTANPLEVTNGGVTGSLFIDDATQSVTLSGGTDGDMLLKANGATRKVTIRTPDDQDCLTIDPVSGIVTANFCIVERALSLKGGGLEINAAHEAERHLGEALPTRTTPMSWLGIADDDTFDIFFDEDTHPAINDQQDITLTFVIHDTVSASALQMNCGIELVGPGDAPADPRTVGTLFTAGTLTDNLDTYHSVTITPTGDCGGDPTKCRMYGRCTTVAANTTASASIPLLSLKIQEVINGL